MASAFKLTLLFIFIFFVFNNAKGVKTTSEEGIGNDSGFSNAPQYDVSLHTK